MKIDSAVLRRLSKLHESGVSVRDIAGQLGWDQQTTIRVLRLLGYNTGASEETWLVNQYN